MAVPGQSMAMTLWLKAQNPAPLFRRSYPENPGFVNSGPNSKEANPMKRTLCTALTILCLLWLSASPVLACTIFSMHRDGEALVGNNEDWYFSYASTGWVTRGQDNAYGRICFSNSGYIQGGMNEKGLFYDGATCSGMTIPRDTQKQTLGWDMGERLLMDCANVDEAIAFLQNHNFPDGFADHILLADPGRSAVVEWLDGQMCVLRGDKPYLIATNFMLSAPEKSGYPCTRYDTAEEALAKAERPTPTLFTGILQRTAQTWEGGGTKYSNVYDLNQLTVTSFAKADFQHPCAIDLRAELSKLHPGERWDFDVDSLCQAL